VAVPGVGTKVEGEVGLGWLGVVEAELQDKATITAIVAKGSNEKRMMGPSWKTIGKRMYR